MGADREELRKWFDREEVIHEYRRRKQRVDARRQADQAARDVDQRRERWR